MTAVNVGEIVSKLLLEDKEFLKAIRRSTRETERFTSKGKASLWSFENAATAAFKKFSTAAKYGFAAATAAATAFGYKSLQSAGDFESGMKGVQAITRATGSDFAQMRQAAIDMGRDTKFSANEAAGALETLARNGLKGADTITKAAQASLDLAAATGTDISTAADIATDAMAQFGFKAEQLTAVINQITQTTKESKFGIEDYFGALSQGGGAAGALGVEFEDFNAALAVTSNLFKSGRDAGTSLKTFITSLPGTSGPAKDAIEELGLEFFDAQGNMKSMAAISGELERAFGDLTEEERIRAASTIFGSDAMRTALGLSRIGEEQFRQTADAIKTQGNASGDAAIRMEGFSGAVTELWSKAGDLAIALGDAGMLGIAEDLVDWVAKNVSEFSKWVRESGKVEQAFKAIADFMDSQFKPAFEKAFKFVGDLIEDDGKGWSEKLHTIMKEAGDLAGVALAQAFETAISIALPAAIEGAFAFAIGAAKSLGKGALDIATLGQFDKVVELAGGKLSEWGFASEKDEKGGAVGGLFQGPKGGFPVMLHGRELIVPMNPGQDPVEEFFRVLGGVPGYATGTPSAGGPAAPAGLGYLRQRDNKDPRDLDPERFLRMAVQPTLRDLLGPSIHDYLKENQALMLKIGSEIGKAMGPGGRTDAMGSLSIGGRTASIGSADSPLAKGKPVKFERALSFLPDELQGLAESLAEGSADISKAQAEALMDAEGFSKFFDALQGDQLRSFQDGLDDVVLGLRDMSNTSKEVIQEMSDAEKMQAQLRADIDSGNPTAQMDRAQTAFIREVESMTQDTGARVDIQSALNLLAGIGTGSSGTGKGTIRNETPNDFGSQIASMLEQARKGAFLDVKQIDFSMFQGLVSDNLIRSVVDTAVSRANSQGAGTGGDVATFVKNQRMIQEVVTELGRLALGSDGLRKAQMDLQMSAHEGTSQLDLMIERMSLLSNGAMASATAMQAQTEAAQQEAEARVFSADLIGRGGGLSANESAMTRGSMSEMDRILAGRWGSNLSEMDRIMGGTRGAGAMGERNVVNITIGGSVVTERQLANVILTHVQRDSRGSIGTGTI